MNTFQSVDNLNNKVAVIIGGSGAVGFATAKRLAGLGATCVLVGRNAIEKVWSSSISYLLESIFA